MDLLIPSSLLLPVLLSPGGVAPAAADRPNVVLIITDDQGFGDLGFYGNRHILTPVLDRFASESIRFNNFYVSPVSAPTRASLLTGRYSLRTGVRDTNNGGALMAAGEYTVAELLKDAGYVTGQFGKWHLGDNYPLRPSDQGFDETLMHLGGGMGQPGDITTYLRGDSSYFDPVLWHNGKREAYKGYCSDIFADAAIEFIKANRSNPFFCYLAFNAPHTPLQLPQKYYELYRATDPSQGYDNLPGNKLRMSEKDIEDARKVYGMVSNIDDNIGRLLKSLDSFGLAENTVVIFMTDNGPQQRRYIAGMRGLKGSVYRGGIRAPLFIRYPALQKRSKDIEALSAQIDLFPTIAELCGAAIPEGLKIDGTSLKAMISGKQNELPERSLFWYWTRRSPELYSNIAVQRGNYKLVGNTDHNAEVKTFELYNLAADPWEQLNIVSSETQKAGELKEELDRIVEELTASENLRNRPYVIAGTQHENPTFLNRNDADGQWGVWDQEEVYGLWRVNFESGVYNFKFRFARPVPEGGRMVLEFGSFLSRSTNNNGAVIEIEVKGIRVPSVKCDFTPFYIAGSKKILPLWVEIEKVTE